MSEATTSEKYIATILIFIVGVGIKVELGSLACRFSVQMINGSVALFFNVTKLHFVVF